MASGPAADLTPRQRIELECARRGKDAVVADCIALLRGSTDLALVRPLVGAGADKYFDGADHEDMYWFRVWGARGLLWAWDARAEPTLRVAMRDDAWRVREMAAKIVARYQVGSAGDAVAKLREDPVPRVRAAAERAVAALIAAGE